jgi:hypothetical protein
VCDLYLTNVADIDRIRLFQALPGVRDCFVLLTRMRSRRGSGFGRCGGHTVLGLKRKSSLWLGRGCCPFCVARSLSCNRNRFQLSSQRFIKISWLKVENPDLVLFEIVKCRRRRHRGVLVLLGSGSLLWCASLPCGQRLEEDNRGR